MLGSYTQAYLIFWLAETIGGQMTNVAAAKAGYIEVYSQVGFIAIGISVLMLLISPVITKMMHGAD